METNILIIEDEEKIARFVELELMHEGYQVDKAGDGRTGLSMAESGKYQLAILDVMLPELNGMEVLRRLRKTSNLPVIMLTARDAVMDKVMGLDSGADDYMTKPFAIEELLARIRLALKKAEALHAEQKALAIAEQNHSEAGASTGSSVGSYAGSSDESGQATKLGHSGLSDGTFAGNAVTLPDHNLLTCGEVVLNKASHTVRVYEKEVILTNREFMMLMVLLENQDIVLSRDTLLEKVCGYDYVGETNVVDVYIRYLRTKIDDAFHIKLIHTVRGVGYVIKSEIE